MKVAHHHRQIRSMEEDPSPFRVIYQPVMSSLDSKNQIDDFLVHHQISATEALSPFHKIREELCVILPPEEPV